MKIGVTHHRREGRHLYFFATQYEYITCCCFHYCIKSTNQRLQNRNCQAILFCYKKHAARFLGLCVCVTCDIFWVDFVENKQAEINSRDKVLDSNVLSHVNFFYWDLRTRATRVQRIIWLHQNNYALASK